MVFFLQKNFKTTENCSQKMLSEVRLAQIGSNRFADYNFNATNILCGKVKLRKTRKFTIVNLKKIQLLF